MSKEMDFQTRQGMLASVLYPHRRVLVKLWKSLTFEPKSEAFGAALIGLITISFLALYVYDLSILSIFGLAIIIGSAGDYALKNLGWINIISPRTDSEDAYFGEVVSCELTYIQLQADKVMDFFDSARKLNPFKFYSMVLILLVILSELTSSISAWVLLGLLSVILSLIPGSIKLCRINKIDPSSVIRTWYASLTKFQQGYQLPVIVSNLVILGLSILFRGYGFANLLIGINILSLLYFLMPSDTTVYED